MPKDAMFRGEMNTSWWLSILKWHRICYNLWNLHRSWVRLNCYGTGLYASSVLSQIRLGCYRLYVSHKQDLTVVELASVYASSVMSLVKVICYGTFLKICKRVDCLRSERKIKNTQKVKRLNCALLNLLCVFDLSFRTQAVNSFTDF